ncbi:NADH:flavin oxidoreductase [uncultured Megasphaera sp.]|jgi:2,4-dienoyl-CoA reductase-like NADH-dependent reductase (Old Yellow Enzyme family)|uniref:NADH:flavin oxidoreductase n=1 Tax=uncultured Megasphaera sp. TaxID=165188 RepID=UPI0025997B48|nr:NADH:flavin oxidoreductase [uncultured Megasphaera sp.]
MTRLMEPGELAGLSVKNHLVRSATWLGLCRPDGSLPPEVYEIYGRLAKGGVGTIITELTDVCGRNNAIGNNMRLYSDALLPDYRKLVDMVHECGAKIIPQLNMYQYVRPGIFRRIVDIDGLTAADLADIRNLYVAAAVRAKECGFDAVQLHLAYGWLLYRFLSPYYNHRRDEYGGSVENRCRLIADIIEGIKAVLPAFPVGAKFSFYAKPVEEIRRLMRQQNVAAIPLSAYYATEECAAICQYLYENGLDFIEVLGDHSAWEHGNHYDSCYLPLAKAVRAVCSIPIVLTGCNNDPDRLEQIIADDGIAFFGLSRALIREPELPARWTQGDRSPASCIHCDGCYQTVAHVCRFL